MTSSKGTKIPRTRRENALAGPACGGGRRGCWLHKVDNLSTRATSLNGSSSQQGPAFAGPYHCVFTSARRQPSRRGSIAKCQCYRTGAWHQRDVFCIYSLRYERCGANHIVSWYPSTTSTTHAGRPCFMHVLFPPAHKLPKSTGPHCPTHSFQSVKKGRDCVGR
jgi:hypothetical protein